MMTDNKLVIADELEDVAMQLAGRGLLAADLDNESCQSFASDVIEEFQRLQLASDMLEYSELKPITDWLIENTSTASWTPSFLVSLQNEGHFFQWAELLAASLRQQDTQLLPALTSCLTSPDWPIPLDQEALQNFLLSLADPDAKVDSQPQDKDGPTIVENTGTPIAAVPPPLPTATVDVPTPAQQSQYTIEWDKDVHPEILEAFLSDTPDQITESTALIHKIAAGKASTDEHQLAARLTHTIKGASGVVGVTSLIAFTHQLEEILEYSVDNKLDNESQELLSASADCLDGMGEAMLNQRPLPNEFEPLLSRLESTAKRLKQAGQLGHSTSDNEASSADNNEDLQEPLVTDFSPPPVKISNKSENGEIEKPGINTELLASQLLLDTPVETQVRSRAVRSNEATMRVPISLIDDLLNLAEELVTSTSQVNDKVKFVMQQSQQLRQQDDRLSKNMDELEQSIDTQFQQVGQQNTQSEAFDQLELEVYNELHSVHGLLSETIADNREIERSMQENLRDLSNHLHSQQRINRELNASILDTRMESLDTLTPRLERIVRETCRSTGKLANFKISGNNLAVDTDILKGLTDPLLHLLRNAVDHGIELKEQRTAKGKPEAGLIELNFQQEGRYMLMSLRDDGGGINAEAIYQQAITQGIVTADKSLSESEKLQLILLPGFTTRDTVSDISGRGIGMDVVNDAVSKLRGTLDLKTGADNGTEIIIRLPLTLVAANTLMVQVSGRTVAVPVDSIDRLHTLPAGSIARDGASDENQLTIRISDKTYQVRRLSQLLNWGNLAIDVNDTYHAILVDHKQQSYALIIDSVLQPREVVVKSLAPWLSNIPGVNGACLLSDGAVAAVLDVPRLMQFDTPETALQTVLSAAITEDTVPLVMVVDDSLSNRKALSITAEQLGYRTVTASDGEEALKLVSEQMPDVILSDLEMPRMNGLELAQAIRSWPEAQHIPIVMITSRATTKHRKQAQLAGVNSYIVKPVDRDTLQIQLKKWLN